MGERFAGRYEFVDVLGQGGMGVVWRAWDHRRGCYLAAKVLRHDDASALLRFVREQSLRVRHPHVVAPSGWAAEDERVLLTTDLVRGGSVQHLLSDYGALPVSYAVALLDQLLAALQAVHAHGIVHRDVKPANLLLHPTGREWPFLRLSDFGIAVVRGEPRLTRRSVVLGTPGYLAPELMRGADPDPRQDLYAVGAVAVEMLTGQVPTREPKPMDRDCPTRVPADMWSVLGELAAYEPGERPPSAEAARERLGDAAAGISPIDSADPDAIEVFDHVGPLPEDFGPDGPISGPAPSASGPHHPGPGPYDTAPSPSAASPGPAMSVTSAFAPVYDRGDGRTRSLVGSAGERGGARPWRGLLLSALLAVAVGVGLVVAALTGAFSSEGSLGGPSPAGEGQSGRHGSSLRVGESCGPLEGRTDKTPAGVTVTCRQGDNGRLTWQKR
ncbi:MAG: protein kinase domain-containing protein [Streptosporangiaceae bacterium]